MIMMKSNMYLYLSMIRASINLQDLKNQEET